MPLYVENAGPWAEHPEIERLVPPEREPDPEPAGLELGDSHSNPLGEPTDDELGPRSWRYDY